MYMPNRLQPPPIQVPRTLPALDTAPLPMVGFVPCYCAEGGLHDLVRIEMVYPAGTRFESIPLVASATSGMLREGTTSFTAEDLAAHMDFYGAQLATDISKDHASVSLLVPGVHLEKVLPAFAEVCAAPAFREPDLDLFKERSRSALEVNLRKVEFNCRIRFSSLLFGGHPYRDEVDPAAYERLDVAAVRNFFQTHYRPSAAACFIAGKGTEQAAQAVAAAFAKWNSDARAVVQSELPCLIYRAGSSYTAQADAMQSAIRIGTMAPTRNQPDYPAFFVMNTILGGYFGSRLMQNLREEKGYTYGIGSAVNHLAGASYIAIATQVGAEHTQAALNEIYSEVQQLASYPVTFDELDLVKNYITGHLLQGLDGPFEQVVRLKILVQNGLPATYYQNLLEAVHAITPEDVKKAAATHLSPDALSVAVVGPEDTVGNISGGITSK